MKMYFSGIASKSEMAMLKQAGIRYLLADPADWKNFHIDDADCAALDSGAYRAWKAGTPLDVETWLQQVEELDLRVIGWLGSRRIECRLDFITMPDVLGDPETTWQRWNDFCNRRLELLPRHWWIDKVIPVWQWGAPRQHLESMIKDAIKSAETVKEFHFNWATQVAIGGLVPHMREQDEAVLNEVKAICADYGQYLHILGLNWLHAIEELCPLAASCDTSKWIDGGRYGTIIFIDEDTGHLVDTHKRCHREYANASREELCIACARNLDAYVNRGERVTPKVKTYARTYQLDHNRSFTAKSEQDEARVEAHNTWMSHHFNVENEKRKEAAMARLEGKPYR